MRNVRRYWQEVRTIQASLPEFVWVVSVENPVEGFAGGCIAQVAAAQAARLLHAGSHRLATEAEIEAHRADEEAARLLRVHARLERQGIAVVPLF
jgi:hypothetical protein